MQVIHRYVRENKGHYRLHQAQVAIAAALVHDVGHGMFSHSFEEIGKKLNLPLARHEMVSEQIIRESEIAGAFAELGGGFAGDVANVIKAGRPGSLYDSVVSSQFDADRLDYMQRDRMMTGVESSAVDATWLLANLEIGSVHAGADSDAAGSIETLILGPKAFRTAESYVLSLFQLYPNVYFHKSTRAAEKVFTSLMLQLINLERDGHGNKTGLPPKHPIRRFATGPDNLSNALALDDAVFWGALPLLVAASDKMVADHASRLWHRRLPKCIDIREWFEHEIPQVRSVDQPARRERNAKILLHCGNVVTAFEEWVAARKGSLPPTFIDQGRREPYKKFQDSQSLLNQILIRSGSDYIDMAEISPVVASAETFEVCRLYVIEDDEEARSVIENIMGTELQSIGNH